MDEGPGVDSEDGTGDESGNGDGREWQFSLEDIDELQETPDREVQPGSPRLEHALFVVLGALATLFAIFRALGG